ncbi:MAG TPA: MBL fold metallo-hydrolase [Allosphingosinicella sp.]
MKIEIFPSASGDCLLLTSSDRSKRLLADAGLPEAYDEFIAGPLSKLRDSGKEIDVAYVSHIDRDHIGGILKLLDDEVKWRAFEHLKSKGGRMKPPKVPRPPKIAQIWHNAFLEDIERTRKVKLGSALAASAGALAGLNAADLGTAGTMALAAETEMLALSVADAIEVNWRIGPDQLDIPLNPDFKGELMTARPGKPIRLGTIDITVLGPTETELEELRKEWIDYLTDKAAYIEKMRKRHKRDVESLPAGTSPAELASLSHAFAKTIEKDVTPPNLASLVLLVEEAGKRILLTGDAGDVSLIRYLDEAGLFDSEGRIEVDVLKVPHHGAKNSYSDEFARRVRASHLIFCGDGEHHNPEPDVVAGYLKAVAAEPLSGGRTTTFWFNWSSDLAAQHLGLWKDVEDQFRPSALPAGVRREALGKGADRLTLDL